MNGILHIRTDHDADHPDRRVCRHETLRKSRTIQHRTDHDLSICLSTVDHLDPTIAVVICTCYAAVSYTYRTDHHLL